MLPVMPALLAAVVLLLAAPPATVPPGTYVLADAGPLGEAVVIGFVVDGRGVLLAPIDDDHAAWGVRVAATPAEAARALLFRRTDLPPSVAVGRHLRGED